MFELRVRLSMHNCPPEEREEVQVVGFCPSESIKHIQY